MCYPQNGFQFSSQFSHKWFWKVMSLHREKRHGHHFHYQAVKMKNCTNYMHTSLDLEIRSIDSWTKNFYNRSKAFVTLALKLRPPFAQLMNELFQLTMKFSTYCTSINIFTGPLVFVKIDTKNESEQKMTNLCTFWNV